MKPLGPREELEAAIALLVAAARRVQRSHADGANLAKLPGTKLTISVDERAVVQTTTAALGRLEQEITDAARRDRGVVAGSALCLRCGSAVCEHAAPDSPRQVFRGWTVAGRPDFVDFAQLLLDRADPRVDRLYGPRPTVLAHTLRRRDLEERLLEAFRRPPNAPEVLVQVTAGWFRLDLGAREPTTCALSLQVVTLGRRADRRFLLHPVVAAELRSRFSVIESPPWAEALTWGREQVANLEVLARRSQTPWTDVVERVEALASGLAERLERPDRARQRRTEHAEDRRQEGRPTPTALGDLASCPDGSFLRDPRNGTWVVLGAKGRVHFFNDDGQLVTSVRYAPPALARRIDTGRWAPAPRSERDRLLARAQAGSETPAAEVAVPSPQPS